MHRKISENIGCIGWLPIFTTLKYRIGDVTTLKSKGRARTQIAKQRKLRATKITRMAQQRHHENPFQHGDTIF
jgi:hypothetical protein